MKASQLKEAFEIQTQIEQLQNQLNILLGSEPKNGSDIEVQEYKRHLSPAARAAIAEGQRRRWAKARTMKLTKGISIRSVRTTA